ncbi:peptidoglycan recognition family protein [Streptomyces sp. AM 3-1-1]|uniref:N-acetylmuramoyl-L-alanine amidase n=1 Tax=Streptomyces sp. AM 3-1-1 TaxID=3028711 RepID=UPI0023BA27C6|nr:peptidoglycan recognition family protein [Streptomyces sp. AM 3-1-1]WEH31436.1 peptidoglycan recognition family protein [Streptomyces sp. AM 3-1-1]
MRGTSPVRSRRRTAAVAFASTALLLPLLAATPAEAARTPAPQAPSGRATGRLQDAFASAAATYHVPSEILLGVSYLQSRWDEHGGAPSVSGGYGPMHLTDARTALSGVVTHPHGEGAEDPRGDTSRPLGLTAHRTKSSTGTLPARLETLPRAASLTGISADRLRGDAAANVAGGAALLAAAQRAQGRSPSQDPADWFGAVAAFSGAEDSAGAASYAEDVFAVIRDGQRRTTDAGQSVALRADARAKAQPKQLRAMGLRKTDAGRTECPPTVACEWVPAPYEEYGDGDYGNHDLADRPNDQSVDSIVIHDTEETWDKTLDLVQDPTYLAWHYTIRSTDGLIAQHVPTKDVGWHAGNWYVNAKSIGIEHEGFLTAPDAWFSESMYRSSARLVKYLAKKYDIPLDRQHILGHDNVPATTTSGIPAMHTDPGPYWDWSHYFALLGKPVRATALPWSDVVTIAPRYEANKPAYTGCSADDPAAACPGHGSSELWLRQSPSDDAPLVKDIGLYPKGEDTTTGVNDVGARVSSGQQYAVAERRGSWVALWYNGQKGWLRNSLLKPVALPSQGLVVTPKKGRADVPVYGRAYPEASAYPANITPQALSPFSYKLLAGQRYVAGGKVHGEYFYSPTFDTTDHKVVRGANEYYEIQFGHRVAYVNADDVTVSRVR